MIDQQRVLDDFLHLVSIRCSTLDEREIGDLLTARLRELGAAEIHEDAAGKFLGGNCGNIVANFKGTATDAPTVMLTAHMDCVEPCANIKPIVEDGVIRSDGTTILGADDKAGVAAILETLRCLKEQNLPHGDLQIVFTVAEEGGVNGSRCLDTALLHADFGYTLDTHGHAGTAAFKAPGKNQLAVRIIGKAAHAGIDPAAGAPARRRRARPPFRFLPHDHRRDDDYRPPRPHPLRPSLVVFRQGSHPPSHLHPFRRERKHN